MDLRDWLPKGQRFDLEALYNTFVGLTPRQQLLTGLGVLGALVVALVLPVMVATAYLGGLQADIAQARKQVEKVVQLVQRYQAARARVTAASLVFQQQSGDTILPAIKRIAEEGGVTLEGRTERGRESFDIYEEEKASFNVKGVNVETLVKLLHAVESSTQRIMRVRELIIAPVYGNRQLLNAEFKEVAAYRLVEEKAAKEPKETKPAAAKGGGT